MSNDYNAGAEHARQIAILHEDLEVYKAITRSLQDQVRLLVLRVNQLERPKMTNEQALKTFDALKQYDSSLNLPSFAAKYGLSVDALRKARTRQRKRSKDMSQSS